MRIIFGMLEQHAARLVVFLVCLLLTAWTLETIYTRHSANKAAWHSFTSSQKITPLLTAESGWQYNASRDADNYMLTPSQCDAAFPDLYYEIDRSVDYWRARGGVQKADLSISFAQYGALRARIRKKQLYILEAKNFIVDPKKWGLKERGLATLHQIQQAAMLVDDLPDMEFSVVTADQTFDNAVVTEGEGIPHAAIWSYTRQVNNESHDPFWVVPDFNFWAWGAIGGTYGDFRREVMSPERDLPIHLRIPKIVWRGVLWTNAAIREALVRASENKPWSDIEAISWGKTGIIGSKVRAQELCRYAMNAHTEGRSWSGRLKYLLNCHAVTFVHQLEWTTFYYHLLRGSGPDQNVVSLNRDFQDLERNVDGLLRDPQKMQQIADNAAATFRDRYITPAAVACYWRHLLGAYAEVSFRPEIDDEHGISFEEFLLEEQNYPHESNFNTTLRV
ncbi:hypothetical protein MBLNU457_g2787t1 [Dothideomycetes sp. NU457]